MRNSISLCLKMSLFVFRFPSCCYFSVWHKTPRGRQRGKEVFGPEEPNRRYRRRRKRHRVKKKFTSWLKFCPSFCSSSLFLSLTVMFYLLLFLGEGRSRAMGKTFVASFTRVGWLVWLNLAHSCNFMPEFCLNSVEEKKTSISNLGPFAHLRPLSFYPLFSEQGH